MVTEELLKAYRGKAVEARSALAGIDPQVLVNIIDALDAARRTQDKQMALLKNYSKAVAAFLRVANTRGLGGEKHEEEDRQLYHDLMTADNAYQGVRAWVD